jgi:quinoprotein glucose dehydrogenase
MAVGLETGAKVWEIPFGGTRDRAPFFPFDLNLGLPSMGGPIVTASGLVFIGASMDRWMGAYHVDTGEMLWKGRLPAGGQATQMNYRLRPDGRQFVVIAAGAWDTREHASDSVVAYVLVD